MRSNGAPKVASTTDAASRAPGPNPRKGADRTLRAYGPWPWRPCCSATPGCPSQGVATSASTFLRHLGIPDRAALEGGAHVEETTCGTGRRGLPWLAYLIVCGRACSTSTAC